MKRNTTRRAFSRLAAVLLAFGVAAASAAPAADGRIYLNPNTPHYKNARYGFSLTLPGGQWEVKEAANGATYNNPKALTYYIEKKAAYDGEFGDPEPSIGANKVTQVPPQIQMKEMPAILEDPANLEKAVTTAANNGIKEVFDITALKILARQNHFFDEIKDDIPGFMKTLDSLCRKLFQFYWHTEKMEEKYGTVKLKALEDSLKCTLDSLSDLTIFFKVRTVDGTQSTGDVTGDLMSGQML